MARRALSLLLLPFLLSLSGCLDDVFHSGSSCPRVSVDLLSAPFDFEYPESQNVAERGGKETDLNLPFDTLHLATGSDNVTVSARQTKAWNPEWTTFAGNASGEGFHRLRLSGFAKGDEPVVSVEAGARAEQRNCSAGSFDTHHSTLEEPVAGDVPKAGQGAHVWTAGFYTNGTLFYTNMEWMDKSAWPRAGWYDFTSGDPLRVYVYDGQRPADPPQQWNVTLPPPLAEYGWRYVTTIEGFNAGLKESSTSTSTVILVPPEKGHTVPGKENHPLYGESLVFYIVLKDVVDIPCNDRLDVGLGEVSSVGRLGDACQVSAPGS